MTPAATAVAPSAAVGKRLMAGPPGFESLADHNRRLGARPSGGPWVIEELTKSGLRGRGGAGFPAGRKWAAVARASAGNAVVVVNASEGEPLSLKDRTLAMLRPHLVLDGALLAAEAVGATEVVVYVSRAVKDTERGLQAALGERARTATAELRPRIVRTQHRYVAGEASALVQRITGGPSKPYFSLVRTSERGVGDRPTLVQNAETMAHVAMIARYGASWFRALGTQGSPGSTLMTLCGNVRRPGVYEVDLAASIGAVLAAAGGAATPSPGALIGGYFGSWLPASALGGTPLESTTIGCGVLAVLPPTGCGLVEATRILTYLAWESAGQCGPCVNGLGALSDAMERIAASRAETGDVEKVRRWIDMVRGRGACHHPDGAVGQLASALDAFRDHLHVHTSGRRCPGATAVGFPRPPEVRSGWR